MSELIKVEKLKEHPRNKEFFDDIKDENWELFLDSVRNNGVIEPIVITNDDFTIISGHQRVRACKELGIEQIHVRFKHYEDDKKRGIKKNDVITEELILTNIRQRGIGNTNPVKMGRCVKELERIYGIEKGNNQHDRMLNNLTPKTQEDLAKELDLSRVQLINYKKLTETIPEIQDLIATQKVSATVGHSIFAKMTTDQQKQMLDMIGADRIENMTTKEVIKEVQIVKELIPEDYESNKKSIEKLKYEISNREKEIANLVGTIAEMKDTEQDITKLKAKKDKIAKEVTQLESEMLSMTKTVNDTKKVLDKSKEMLDYIGFIKTKHIEFLSSISAYEFHEATKDRLDTEAQELTNVLYNALNLVVAKFNTKINATEMVIRRD